MSHSLLTAIRAYFLSYSGLPKPCWHGIFLSFVESVLIGIYFFLPLYFINELHFTIASASFIISFFGVGCILGGLFSGKLSDKLNPGLIAAFCLFIQAIAITVLAYLRSPASLMGDLFVMGFASYGFITSNHLWVLNQCAKQEKLKLRTINILSVASNLGLGLSGIIIGALSSYGFQPLIVSCGILLWVLFFYSLWLKKISPVLSEKTLALLSQNNLSLPLNDNNKLLWAILFCVFLIGLVMFQLNTTYAIFIQDSFPDLGLKAVSILFALNCFSVVLFQTSITDFFANRNKVLLAGYGALLIGLGMFILTFTFSFSLAILSCVIYTLGEMIFFSVAQFICYQYGSAEKKGARLGLYRTVYASSRVIGPAVGGLIYQQLGSDSLWYVCGFIGIACLSICHLHKKNKAFLFYNAQQVA